MSTLSKNRRVQLLCDAKTEKAWAAVALLTQGLGWISLDAVGDFLKDCQRRAAAVKFNPKDVNTRYALKSGTWDEPTIVEAIRTAGTYRLLRHHRFPDGQNHLISVPTEQHTMWTVPNAELPVDPSWNYANLLRQTPE